MYVITWERKELGEEEMGMAGRFIFLLNTLSYLLNLGPCESIAYQKVKIKILIQQELYLEL